MKQIVTIVLTLLSINLSLAKEVENLSPPMELMKLIKFENTLVNTSKLGFAPFLNQLSTKGMPEAGVQEVKEVSDIYFSQVASDLDLKKEMAGLYEEKFTENELKAYLKKISDEKLYAYNVYQIEGEGRSLFSKIKGDENTIMGLPIDKIKEYLNNYE